MITDVHGNVSWSSLVLLKVRTYNHLLLKWLQKLPLNLAQEHGLRSLSYKGPGSGRESLASCLAVAGLENSTVMTQCHTMVLVLSV